MAHADHHHDPSSYYTEQLCTIAFCGAFGGIAVAIYMTGLVNNILKQGILQYSLLAGGIALLVLVFVRAVALWFTVGKPEAACDHHHHDDCCGDEHQHEQEDGGAHGLPLVTETAHEHPHDHSHGDAHSNGGHDHDHGWAPVRYIVLLVPVLLYFFVPIDALSSAQGYGGDIDPKWSETVKATRNVGELEFRELVGAADDAGRRKFYENAVATISGQFVPSPDSRMFSLTRYRIRCCAADAVALPVPVLLNFALAKDLAPEQCYPDKEGLYRKWVQVTCQIQFRPRPDSPNVWMPVLVVIPTKETPINQLIQLTPPDPNPYL